jgi:hypothetical protein
MSHVCEKFKARKRRKVAWTPDWKGEECNL